MKYKKLKVPMFGYSFFLYSPEGEEAFEKAYEVEIPDFAEGFHNGNGVWVREDKDGLEMMDSIVHEVSHSVDWFFAKHLFFCKEPDIYSITEVRAYLTGWLVKEYVKFLRKEGYKL